MSASSTPRDISPNSNSTFLGRRKSGRKWKETAQRSSARIISRGDKRSFHSWTVKAQKRQEASFRKQAKAERKAQLDQLQQEMGQKAKARRERRQENERKGQIVQKVTNSKKLRRLSKKQLSKMRVDQ